MKSWTFSILPEEPLPRARARLKMMMSEIQGGLAIESANRRRREMEQRFEARYRVCKLRGCKARFFATKRQEHCTPEHGQRARDQRKAERKAK